MPAVVPGNPRALTMNTESKKIITIYVIVSSFSFVAKIVVLGFSEYKPSLEETIFQNRYGNNYQHKGNETMDAATTKSMRTNASKPLNMPESLSVEEDPVGLPTGVKLKQRHRITTIKDYWRIDDEWWRSEPISRIYYAVILDSGRRIVLCHNLIDNRWYSQSY